MAATSQMETALDRDSGLEALADLRATRRRRYAEQIDWMEALYRIYVGAIVGVWGLALIAGALEDVRVDQQGVDDINRLGPALIGLAVALGVAGGLRSGGHGGPLAIEAADVQHVLLSPVDRGAALRGAALRRLRTPAFAGAVVGLVVANFAFRRLPGSPAGWLAVAALVGALIPLWALGTALVASGRCLRPRTVNLLCVAIVAWSMVDLLLGSTTSPATMLGLLAVSPLPGGGDAVLALLGLAAVAATCLVGFLNLGGTSLGAARRRAALAAQLRFAVTLQDLRTIILLRRQLASETPRRQPWLRLPSSARTPAIWRRDWQSFLRWPAARLVRVCVLAAAIGVSLCGAWQGTTPLVAVAGLLVMVAGLDAVEPLAQEIDHPTRRDLLPIPAGQLIRRHLIAPTAFMVGPALVAVAAALLIGARPATVLEVGLVMMLPTALLALCCAALMSTNDPYAYVFTPEFGFLQTGFPVALAMLGVGGPLLAAREAVRHGHSAAAFALSAEWTVLLYCLGAIWWLGRRIKKRAPVEA
jgi:hypothetical protein